MIDEHDDVCVIVLKWKYQMRNEGMLWHACGWYGGSSKFEGRKKRESGFGGDLAALWRCLVIENVKKCVHKL
jgi:hypothetical protein